MHILEGIIFATEHAEQILSVLLNSKRIVEVKSCLIEKYRMSDMQAQAVAEMRIRLFTENEKLEVKREIERLLTFLEELQSNSDK